MPGFKGLRISQDVKVDAKRWGIQRVEVLKEQDRLVMSTFGVLGWGGNSGFHALNLAVQFGSSKIILVGYDMRLDHGLHWHGRHTDGLNNPTPKNVERWRRVIDEAASALEALDVQVINASPISALSAYPKMSLEDALRC